MKSKIEFKVKANAEGQSWTNLVFQNNKHFLTVTPDDNIGRSLRPKEGDHFKVTIERVRK